jgi:hypothetical protein
MDRCPVSCTEAMMNTQNLKYDIFLAHAGADHLIAKQLYDLLVSAHRVFLDSETLLPGDLWDDEIPRAQRAARISVILISSKTEDAYYEREEIAAAIDLARRNESEYQVVPVYLDGRNAPTTVPYRLRRLNGIYLEKDGSLGDIAATLAHLLQSLAQRAGKGSHGQ